MLGLYWGYVGVIFGLYLGYVGVILGLYSLERLRRKACLRGPTGSQKTLQGFIVALK